MNFNEKLKTIRKLKNVTQQELANKLYVSRQAVQKWESGDSLPDIDKLPQISKELGLSIDELLNPLITEDELIKKVLHIEEYKDDILELAKKASAIDWIILSVIVSGTILVTLLLHLIGILILIVSFGVSTSTLLLGVYSFINIFYNLQRGTGPILINLGGFILCVSLAYILYKVQVSLVVNYVNFAKKAIERIRKYVERRGNYINEA